MERKRNEEKYRNVKSKDGTFSPHIGKQTTERLTKYCHIKNINRTKFVEMCINERLDVLERDFYESLTKDELIDLILK